MDGATLRALALDALGPHDPPRAAEVLSGSMVTVDPDVQAWTASAGTVHGQRVRLTTDARTLGMLRAAPAVTDAVYAAFAHALGTVQGETLGELTLVWSGEVHGGDDPYRGGHPREGRDNLASALAEYLDGADEPDTATLVRGSVATTADHGDDAVTVTVTTAVGGPSPHVRSAVRDAVKALLGAGATVAWRPGR